MRVAKIVATAVTGIAVVSTVIPGSGAGPQSAILRLKFKVGQTLSYRMAMGVNGTITRAGGTPMPLQQDTDMTANQTVQSIDPTTGAATIVGHLIPGTTTVTLNGKPIPASKMPPTPSSITITSVVEPNGKIDSYNLSTASGPPSPINLSTNNAMFGAIFMPNKQLTIGDTWSRMTTGGIAGLNYMSYYKLSNLSTSGGDQIATVDCSLNGTMSTSTQTPVPTTVVGQLSGSQTTLFDNTTGMVKSMSGSSHLVMNTASVIPNTPQAGAAAGKTVHSVVDLTQTVTMTLTGE